MTEHPESWIDHRVAEHRQLLLVIDSMAEPNPIPELFSAGLMADCKNLLLGTELSDLAAIGPWLVRLTEPDAPAVQKLLGEPSRLWGWLGCIDRETDIEELAQHWLDRMLFVEDGQRSLYRFQDPRVLARSIAHMSLDQVPQLLGPVHSVLVWDGERWQTHDNPNPGRRTFAHPAPWLYPEPPDIAKEIRLDNLEQWLWENHPDSTASLASERMLREWLDECLTLGATWHWEAPEQLYLLVDQHRGANATDPRWLPLHDEPPQAHFERCHHIFSATSFGTHA